MKTAQLPNGQPIEAGPNAPQTAVCPHCGGQLTLRSRRAMNNGHRAYFWRHQSNQNHTCPARRHPTG